MFMTRDLVNEPANVLTTTEFARRLGEMSELGLEVEILGARHGAEVLGAPIYDPTGGRMRS